MKCELCKKNIEKYNIKLNHLELNENKTVDLCQDCIDKFLKWQQEIFAELFPTKAIKKRFGKKDYP